MVVAKMRGMTLPRWIRRLSPFTQQIKCILAPLLLSFIPAIWPRKEAYCAYVVAIMAYYWISQALPIAVTAMLPVFLFPIFQVAVAKDISGVYFSDSNVLFFGSMVLAVAVEASNFHERVALRILLITGPNPRRMLLGAMVGTSVLSLFISNTATTALMAPIICAVIRELERCRTNDVEFNAPLDHIEPHDVGNEDGTLNLEGVPKERVEIYKALLLSVCFSASASGTIMLTATGANIVLSGHMEEYYGAHQPITFASWILYSLPIALILLVILYFWLIILFIGFKSFDDSQSSTITNLLRKKYSLLGPMRYVEKSLIFVFFGIVLLWLFRDPKVIPGWGNLFPDGYVTDGTVSIFVAMLLFFLPAENPFTYSSISNEPLPTIMQWKYMSKFSWSTFLLLGGGYGIARGVERSGLSQLMSNWLSNFNKVPDWAFLMLSGLMVTFLTEFSSNITTASIFIPLMDNLAKARHANPLKFILPITLSCSYAFVFPAGTPPNAIIFGLKAMRLIDMVKAGLVLNIFGFILTQGLTLTWGNVLFHTNSLPDWALHNTTMA